MPRIRIFVNRKILILRNFIGKNDKYNENFKNKTNSKDKNFCEYRPRMFSFGDNPDQCQRWFAHLVLFFGEVIFP